MSTGLKTDCPHCGKTLKVSAEQAGKRVRCPACRQPFEISAVGVAGATSIAPSQAATDTQATTPMSTTPVHVPADKQIGRFKLQAELGRGGFGQVFRAYDPVLERDVALKLPRFTAVDDSQRRRFVVEAKSAARLKHPHIVGVYESGEADGQPYIVSEFVSGETLAHRLKQQRPSLSQSVIWIRDLAEALAYAHREGVVHRDIKPENIMLGGDDRPQIMDFGLAKRTNEESSLTMEGSVLGTPAYMSPEQAQGDLEHVGPASDQYSLGATLYQLLTGQPPFSGPPHKVVAAVTSVEPLEPQKLNSNIPADLQAIVQKAMHKDAARRYADISLFASDLDRWLRAEPVRARPISVLERTVRWCRKNRTVATLITAVVVISLTGTTVTALLWSHAARSGAQARKANTDLEAQQGQLIQATKEAEASAKEAIAAAKKEKQAKEDLRHRTYVAEIKRVQTAIGEGDVVLARQILEGLKPVGDEPDLRDFEWHYLWRCCHLSQSLSSPNAARDWVRAVAFSPDGTQLAASEGPKIHLWNVATKTKERTLDAHQYPVMTVCWHPNGKRLCSGSANVKGEAGELFLWETDGWAKSDLELNGLDVMQAVYSKDGQKLFVATAEATPGAGTPSSRYINLFSEKSGELLEYRESDSKIAVRRPSKSAGLMSVAVSPDEKWLASGDANGRIRLWQQSQPDADPQLLTGQFRFVWSLQFASDNRHLFSVSGDNIFGGNAFCWDVEAAQMLGALDVHAQSVYGLAYSPQTNLLGVAGYDRSARLWKVPSLYQTLKDGTERWWNAKLTPDGVGLGHEWPISCLAFSPDGRMMASGSWEGEVRLWHTDHVVDTVDWQNSLAGLEPVRKERNFAYNYGSLGRVYGTEQNEIDVNLGPPSSSKEPHPTYKRATVKEKIRYAAASNDRKLVALGTWSSGLIVEDVATKTEVFRRQMTSHTRPVFSDDDEYLAAAVDDGIIRLFRVSDWKLIREFKGHTDVIWDVWFSPNRRRLASGSWDGTTRVWDVETGEELLVLPRWGGHLMFDREGKTLSGSSVVWRTMLPEEQDQIETTAQVARDEKTRPPQPKPGVPYDREFAEWFLSHGGNSVSVKTRTAATKPPLHASSPQELPSDDFVVTHIRIGNDVRTIQNESLSTLPSLSSLRSIVVSSGAKQIGDAAYANIGQISKLEFLGIDGGSLTTAGLKHVAHLSELNDLRIHSQRPYDSISLNGEGLRLISRLKKLSQLNLRSTELRDDDLAPLAELPTLRWLGLFNSPITGAGLKPLSALESLNNIHITSEVFNDDGVKALAQFPSLIGMHLQSPAVTNEGIEAISKSPKLVNLFLSLKGVDEHGIEHLAHMTSLRFLNFYEMPLTDDGLAELTILENLETLTLNQVPVTAEGLQHLLKLPKLRNLNIFFTGITTEQMNEFKPKLPNVKIEFQPKVAQN